MPKELGVIETRWRHPAARSMTEAVVLRTHERFKRSLDSYDGRNESGAPLIPAIAKKVNSMN